MVRTHYILIILLHFAVAGVAQEQDSYRFYGRVMKENAFTPVKFAYVVDVDKGSAVLADSSGYFEMDVSPYDTLYISALSYSDKHYVVPEAMPHDFSEWIYLSARSYELEEATIYWLGSYQDFKAKVKNLKLEKKDEINPEALKIFPKPTKEHDPYAGPGIISPISLIFMSLNGELKNLKKAKVVNKKMKSLEKYKYKFNAEIVSQVTGIEGEEIDRFMHFCSFSESFLLESKEYEILEAVKQKYKRYVERKEKGTLPSLDNLNNEVTVKKDTTETKNN